MGFPCSFFISFLESLVPFEVDPFFLLAAIPAVLITGLSKGGFGGGLIMLGTPLLALVVSPIQAAAVMLPILVLMDAIGLWNWRRRIKWSILRHMLPAATVGIGIGWASAAFASDDLIRILVGTIAIGFSAERLIAAARKKIQPRKESFAAASLWGVLAGYSSFVCHAGAPPYQAYALPLKMEKTLFAGTGIAFFATVNLIKTFAYFSLGQFTTLNLSLSAILTPVAVIGVLLGVRLTIWSSERVFYAVAHSAMPIIGIMLIHAGLTQ